MEGRDVEIVKNSPSSLRLGESVRFAPSSSPSRVKPNDRRSARLASVLFDECGDDGRISTLTSALAGISLSAVIGDIGLNISVFQRGPCSGQPSVGLPPPSAFRYGFRLPFFFGIEIVFRRIDVPVFGDLGLPQGFVFVPDPQLGSCTPQRG